MRKSIKLYDSFWLSEYLNAVEIIKKVCPHKQNEFVRAFDILKTRQDFKVVDVDDILDNERLSCLKNSVNNLKIQEIELHEFSKFGRFVVHNRDEFTVLQRGLEERVSELVGENVESSYNFLSMYTKMGVLEPHLDAPSAKWTLDICIDQSEVWPIYISQVVPWPENVIQLRGDRENTIKGDPKLNFVEKSLTPGKAIIFSGSSQWHYRNALSSISQNGYCTLLFFHYIPRGTVDLVSPENWADLFGITELKRLRKLPIR